MPTCSTSPGRTGRGWPGWTREPFKNVPFRLIRSSTYKVARLDADAGVLPTRPGPLDVLLPGEFDVHRAVARAAEGVAPGQERERDAGLLAAEHHEAWHPFLRDGRRRRERRGGRHRLGDANDCARPAPAVFARRAIAAVLTQRARLHAHLHDSRVRYPLWAHSSVRFAGPARFFGTGGQHQLPGVKPRATPPPGPLPETERGGYSVKVLRPWRGFKNPYRGREPGTYFSPSPLRGGGRGEGLLGASPAAGGFVRMSLPRRERRRRGRHLGGRHPREQ